MLALRSGALILLALLTPIGASASDRPWYKYENRYFIAHSDASEKQTLALLKELERFRAAVLYVSGFAISEGADKTEIIIIGDRDDFRRLTPTNTIGAFAQPVDGRTLIVMPASRGAKWGISTIKHEYTHALLQHREFDYPTWYNEGFAEMTSTTKFVDNGNRFRFGEPINRPRTAVSLPIEWDELLSRDFRIHGTNRAARIRDVYHQTWLLAHYATLGDDLNNAYRLQHYFSLLKEGRPSVESFETAYEISVRNLWNQVLRPYAKRIPVVVYEFDPRDLDLSFPRTTASREYIDPRIEFFTIAATAYKKDRPPRRALAKLNGRWDAISFKPTCVDGGKITVDEGISTFTFDSFEVFSQSPEPSTVKFRIEDRGVYILSYPFPDAGEDQFDVRLSMRTEDILCMSPSVWPAKHCKFVLKRCLAPHD